MICKKMIKIWIKKLINIPTIQVSFMNKLKISAIKNIKISVTTIIKITDRNAGMQNVLNCQITSIGKMRAKLFKIFPNFCDIYTFNTVCLDIRCWKI